MAKWLNREINKLLFDKHEIKAENLLTRTYVRYNGRFTDKLEKTLDFKYEKLFDADKIEQDC